MITTRASFAAVAFSFVTIAAGPAGAVDRMHWTQLPDPAFHEVFAYYCAPAQIVNAALPADTAPTGDAADIHDGLFIAEYGGDCRAFYFKEIVRRIDVPTQQGLIVVDR
jgi:hypothetical protein